MAISSDYNTKANQRKIRSFTNRISRITTAQKDALAKLWPDYGIEYTNKSIPTTACFGRNAPLVIDIGPGNGDVIIHHAQYHPENNYIAIEVHPPSVGQLLRKIERSGLNNIRIINHDAYDVFCQFAAVSVDEVFIFFPDPWPKKRHHKRRLLQAGFISLINKKLKAHGRLFIATDWGHYATHILNLCDSDPGLLNLAGKGNPSPRPGWRKLTKYEYRGLCLKHKIMDFCYAKNQLHHDELLNPPRLSL